MRIILIFTIVITVLGCSNTSENAHARQMLKDYGLVQCLLLIEKDNSTLKSDLSLASGSLHYMGNGQHQIVQNEQTLETEHDPYKDTVNYIKSHIEHAKGVNHRNNNIYSYGCLEIYNSEEFSKFIDSQDQYIFN